MNSCELVAFITSLSCTLYNNIPQEELVFLTTALTQLSVTLSTMLAAGNNESNDNGNENLPTDFAFSTNV